jgi:hypothetical protein
LRRLAGGIDRGWQAVAAEHEQIREHVREVKRMQATGVPGQGNAAQRKERFHRLRRRRQRSGDPVRVQMAAVMASFVVGLCAGAEVAEGVQGNLGLERWFRLPKGHERRIHGRKHAGVRLVQEGATLRPVRDAHQGRGEPYRAEELMDDREAKAPPHEEEARRRRQVMRRARSRKRRPDLLAELERRYQATP